MSESTLPMDLAKASASAAKKRYLLLALPVLALDQWSKWLVETHLPLYSSKTVIPGFLNLTHVKNSGVAFGLFAEKGSSPMGPWLLTALGVAALAVVLLYFWRLPATNRGLHVALALVLGGALGNLIDRIGSGAVTDFIDAYFKSYHWHTFNVADSAITVGIVLILIDTLQSYRTAPGSEPDNE